MGSRTQEKLSALCRRSVAYATSKGSSCAYVTVEERGSAVARFDWVAGDMAATIAEQLQDLATIEGRRITAIVSIRDPHDGTMGRATVRVVPQDEDDEESSDEPRKLDTEAVNVIRVLTGHTHALTRTLADSYAAQGNAFREVLGVVTERLRDSDTRAAAAEARAAAAEEQTRAALDRLSESLEVLDRVQTQEAKESRAEKLGNEMLPILVKRLTKAIDRFMPDDDDDDDATKPKALPKPTTTETGTA